MLFKDLNQDFYSRTEGRLFSGSYGNRYFIRTVETEYGFLVYGIDHHQPDVWLGRDGQVLVNSQLYKMDDYKKLRGYCAQWLGRQRNLRSGRRINPNGRGVKRTSATELLSRAADGR